MTIFFRDYSEYNTVVPDSYPVRIARATIGLVKDRKYEAERAQAELDGDFFVAYHFLNAHQIDDPAAQARFCYTVLGHTIPLMLDWEPNRGYCATVADAWTFINTYRALGGIVHTYYLPHWAWQGNLGSPDLRQFQAQQLNLVSSNYTNYSDTGVGWLPYGGVTPMQWQFTSTPIDTNAFRGTLQEYEQLVYPELVFHTPTVNEDDMFHQLKVPGDSVTLTPPSVSSGKGVWVSLTTGGFGTNAVVQAELYYDNAWHDLGTITVVDGPANLLPLIDNTNVRNVYVRHVSGPPVGVSAVTASTVTVP